MFKSPTFCPHHAAIPPHAPSDHPATAQGKIGVLLLQLGTPDGTSYGPMRRYLKQFLSDNRVIEVPRLIWWPLLNGIILSTRPSRKGKDYATIWNHEKNEGPLLTITREQSEKIAERLSNHPNVIVDFAMRYGNPATGPAIEKLQAQGCDRILLLPLYPQYAAATTATAADEAFRQLMTMRWQPAIRVAPAWADHSAYIKALAKSITDHLSNLDWEPEKLVVSFHGVPKKYLLKGDPYHCQCAKTARLLRDELGWNDDKLIHTFQSRFGTDEWLRPYTDETMERLAKEGVKRVAIVAPGFTTDCLETLEELDGENRHIFEEHGGENFTYIPCLNASPAGIDVLMAVIRNELAGWVDVTSS